MILVIGDMIRDEYWLGTCDRLSPEAPVPIIANPRLELHHGGASNVYRSLKALKNKVYFLYDNKNYSTKKRMYANGHFVCRIDQDPSEFMKWPYTLKILKSHTKDVRYAVLSDYNKTVLTNPFPVIDQLNSKGVKCLVDPKKDFENYRNAWLIKPNRKELEHEVGKIDNLEEHCKHISETYNIPNVVVTLGKDGMCLYSEGAYKHFTSTEKRVIDVTGAGDVVMAALAHYLDKGYDLFYACEMANRLAGISITEFGSYILKPEDLVKVESDKIIFTNGCFDILHAGHIHYLQKSKQLGGKLVVGLNSDKSIRRLKGKGRPVNNQRDRKKMLEALEFVDEVIIFDDDTPYDLIRKLKPQIITKGGDYTPIEVVGNDLAKVVIIPILEGYSTTKVMDEIRR